MTVPKKKNKKSATKKGKVKKVKVIGVQTIEPDCHVVDLQVEVHGPKPAVPVPDDAIDMQSTDWKKHPWIVWLKGIKWPF